MRQIHALIEHIRQHLTVGSALRFPLGVSDGSGGGHASTPRMSALMAWTVSRVMPSW